MSAKRIYTLDQYESRLAAQVRAYFGLSPDTTVRVKVTIRIPQQKIAQRRLRRRADTTTVLSKDDAQQIRRTIPLSQNPHVRAYLEELLRSREVRFPYGRYNWLNAMQAHLRRHQLPFVIHTTDGAACPFERRVYRLYRELAR